MRPAMETLRLRCAPLRVTDALWSLGTTRRGTICDGEGVAN